MKLPEQTDWKTMRQMQIEYFWKTFEACKWDIQRTAEILGIGRAGVYRYKSGEYNDRLLKRRGSK